MTDTMKAVVKEKAEPGAVFKEVPIPKPAKNEVLVKVKATSICGTDVHIYNWNEWAQNRIKVPQIMGHEFAGEVIETGDCCSRIKVGDYISAETHIPCYNCVPCLSNQHHICENLVILGVDGDGCFAEYAAIPETVCWVNDKSIPPDFASVQEPLGNAVYCSAVEPLLGQSVLIFGDGPTGLFSAGVARVAGATRIAIVGRHPVRLDIARKMGADITINDNEIDDTEKAIREAVNDELFDVILDMAGTQKAVNIGLSLVRKGGRFSAFGVASGDLTIDYNNGIVFKGSRILGINGRLMYETWLIVKNLLSSGRLDISPVITHRLPLDEFDKGFELMTKRPKVSGKVVLYPEGVPE
jgi:threonine 3-dehydrogenase